jgi:hypothetical protein
VTKRKKNKKKGEFGSEIGLFCVNFSASHPLTSLENRETRKREKKKKYSWEIIGGMGLGKDI